MRRFERMMATPTTKMKLACMRASSEGGSMPPSLRAASPSRASLFRCRAQTPSSPRSYTQASLARAAYQRPRRLALLSGALRLAMRQGPRDTRAAVPPPAASPRSGSGFPPRWNRPKHTLLSCFFLSCAAKLNMIKSLYRDIRDAFF